MHYNHPLFWNLEIVKTSSISSFVSQIIKGMNQVNL